MTHVQHVQPEPTARLLPSKRLSQSSWLPAGRRLKWHKIRRGGAHAVALSPAAGLDVRMWFLAVSRAGARGHAVFEPGELREMLPKFDRSSGVVSVYSDKHIRRTIGEMAEAGLVASTSTTRCLVLPMNLVDLEASSRVLCPEHRHLCAWFRGEWVDLDRSGRVVLPDAA